MHSRHARVRIGACQRLEVEHLTRILNDTWKLFSSAAFFNRATQSLSTLNKSFKEKKAKERSHYKVRYNKKMEDNSEGLNERVRLIQQNDL